jgi:hypothetical protein
MKQPDTLWLFEARKVLSKGLSELLPATAEAFDPFSEIELDEDENALAVRLALFLEERIVEPEPE